MTEKIERGGWIWVGGAMGIDVGYTCPLLANKGRHGVVVVVVVAGGGG